MSLNRNLFVIPLLILVPCLWTVYLLADIPEANDFYPLYFAARRILAGQSPYGLAATSELALQWDDSYPAYELTGVAYPLPLILLVILFTYLSVPVATFLWSAIGLSSSYLSALIPQQQRTPLQNPTPLQWLTYLLPFTFYPLMRGVELQQATLLWFGLTALLFLSMRRNCVSCAAICTVLLMLKPQNGLLFALYGLWWLLSNHRQGLLVVCAFGGSLLGLSLVIQPSWITAWLEQIEVYSAVVQPPTVLPIGLVALLVFWRFNLWVKVAIAQVILFPLSDVYSTLPLLWAWYSISPLVAFLGSAISWLWVLQPGPTPLYMVWLLVFTPLLLAALWEARPMALRKDKKASGKLPAQVQLP